MKRSGSLTRRTRLRAVSPTRAARSTFRGTPVKRVNVKRKASAFAEAYHSVERQQWVKTLRCAACKLFGFPQKTRSVNAHTGKKPGKGLKSHYSTIAPLCERGCHEAYDEYRKPFDRPEVRQLIADAARETEQAWQAHVHQL